jgi:uncharacterized protein YcbK (DUF882 family)
MKKRFFLTIAILIVILVATFVLYCNNLSGVDPITIGYYNECKVILQQKGYTPNFLVVSAKRFKWHNAIQVRTSGAAKQSQHIPGKAIDFIVFDINGDGKSDSKDVNLVYEILDKQIIKNEGGIGTYKMEESFFYRQMIHIDCRGIRKRWVESPN